jgi:ribosomal-protein-alanine N-acetyltransferase
MHMLKLVGDRIILRDQVVDDLDAIHQWLADPETSRFLSWATRTKEETLLHLAEGICEQLKEDRQKYYLTMVLKDEGTVIGDAGIEVKKRGPGGGEGEIGYFLIKRYWGRGYATEAARLVIDYGFSQLGLHRITASCLAANAASERVMQKCGMVKEGMLRKSDFRQGEWQDRLCYSVLREEWALFTNISIENGLPCPG